MALSEIKTLITLKHSLLEDFGIKLAEKGGKIKIISQEHPCLSILVLVFAQILHMADEPFHSYECVVVRNGATDVEVLSVHEDEFLRRDSDWLWRKLGLVSAAAEENVELIIKLLRRSAYTAKERSVYDCIGWVDAINPEFIYGQARLTSSGRTTVENIQQGLAIEHISACMACSFIKNDYLSILHNRLYSEVMLCFEALSLLKPILVKYGQFPRFSLYIWGVTGSGKTSTTFPLLNPFGMESISVNDSLAAAMHVVGNNRASVTIFDDLKSKRNKRAVELVETVLRIVGDENTSVRRKLGNKIASVSMANLAAFTAEIEPPLQTSSFPRLLMLPFDRNTVNLENLKSMEGKIVDFRRKNIAFLLKFLEFALMTENFVQRFCGDYEAELARQREQFEGLHGRYYESLAWMITAWRSICAYAQRYGISFADDNFETNLHNLVCEQHKRYSPQSPVIMYCIALFDLVERGTIRIVKNSMREHAGVLEIIEVDGLWQIRSKLVFEKIQAYYEERQIDFNVSERHLREQLLRAGIISKSRNAQTITTDNRRIDGVTFSYMSFRPHCAEEIVREWRENEWTKII